jgi:hypothetical protein
MNQPYNPATDLPQIPGGTVAHVPIDVRALQAAILVQGRATLKTPTTASMARAFSVTPYLVTKKLRALGRKPRVYRKRLPFPPPSSSAPPAAPAFMSLSG